MIDTLPNYYPDSISDVLKTAGGLEDKVRSDGTLLPFPGNTVVFLLDEPCKNILAQIRDRLYENCAPMLAETLKTDTFHITLHDLANGSLLPQREQMASQATEILRALRANPFAPIPMRATWCFNMVNTSIVLGLEPENDEAWQTLDDLYDRFQQVRNLPYALTPHITLAYFRPGVYTHAQTAILRQAMGAVDLRLTLEPDRLVLQDFDHMNAYKTVY